VSLRTTQLKTQNLKLVSALVDSRSLTGLAIWFEYRGPRVIQEAQGDQMGCLAYVEAVARIGALLPSPVTLVVVLVVFFFIAILDPPAVRGIY
jgi:hypothetical protein